MKKNPLLTSLATTVILAISISTASAARISVGGTAQYNWWNPVWNNGKLIIYSPESYKYKDGNAPTYTPLLQFMYGPDISVLFHHRWEISPSFRYSEGETNGAGFGLFPSLVYRKISSSIKQYDIHATAGYYILDYLKLFIGFRAEIFDYAIQYKHLQLGLPAEVFFLTMETRTLQFTPELGMKFTVPLSEVFTLLADISGTFLSGSEKAEYKNPISNNGLVANMAHVPTGRYYAVGCNASLAMSITIPKAPVSFTLGGYYRLLRYIQKASDEGFYVYDKSLDHNLGAQLSVAYSFSFGEHTEKSLWIPRPEYD